MPVQKFTTQNKMLCIHLHCLRRKENDGGIILSSFTTRLFKTIWDNCNEFMHEPTMRESKKRGLMKKLYSELKNCTNACPLWLKTSQISQMFPLSSDYTILCRIYQACYYAPQTIKRNSSRSSIKVVNLASLPSFKPLLIQNSKGKSSVLVTHTQPKNSI